MRYLLQLNCLLIGLFVFNSSAQAQQISPGKTYSIRCAAKYNDIDMYLSSRFNSTETIVQMNRMENQSAWQFEVASGGYKLMSVRHKGYIFMDNQGRLMITKDKNQANVFSLQRALSGNFYFKTPSGSVLKHQTRSVILADGKAMQEQKVQEAEWVVTEVVGQ